VRIAHTASNVLETCTLRSVKPAANPLQVKDAMDVLYFIN